MFDPFLQLFLCIELYIVGTIWQVWMVETWISTLPGSYKYLFPICGQDSVGPLLLSNQNKPHFAKIFLEFPNFINFYPLYKLYMYFIPKIAKLHLKAKSASEAAILRSRCFCRWFCLNNKLYMSACLLVCLWPTSCNVTNFIAKRES